MVGSFSRILNFVVALAVGVAPLQSYADEKDFNPIRIQTRDTDSAPISDLKIESLEPGTEKEVIANIRRSHPDAPITVFTEGVDPQTSQDLESLPKDKNIQIIRINGQLLALRTLQVIEENPRYRDHPVEQQLQQVKKSLTRTEKVKEYGKRLRGTLISSLMFGASFYITTSDVDMTTKMFLLALVVNGFQIMGTTLWQKYLDLGGKVGAKVHRVMANIISKTVAGGQGAENIGRVLAAYGFSAATAVSVVAIQDVQVSAWWIASMGALATWDMVWDLVFDRHIKLGNLKEERLNQFITGRLFISPIVEGAFWSSGIWSAGATVVMAVIGGAGLISLFTANQMHNANQRRKARNEAKALETQGLPQSGWQKIKNLWQKKSAGNRSQCEEILDPPATDQRNKANDQSSFFPPSKTITSWPSGNWIEAGSLTA